MMGNPSVKSPEIRRIRKVSAGGLSTIILSFNKEYAIFVRSEAQREDLTVVKSIWKRVGQLKQAIRTPEGLDQSIQMRLNQGWEEIPVDKTDRPHLVKPPSQKVMERWENEGFCKATDGCKVEPDGICEHGYQSWLLELGLV
jgi:hypothetical protein